MKPQSISCILAAAAAALLLSTPASAAGPAAASPPAPHPGQAVFKRHCAECHAPGVGHPGTQQLGWLKGEASAVLEQRKDLLPEYVKHVVRHGLLEMPPIRPSEVSDQQLEQLADYLAPARPAKSGRRR
ncbi:MAG: hypothetical protein RL026_340 [Pseudomonadota bacterium]|jgi:mono/diheme cytochrome c family protein